MTNRIALVSIVFLMLFIFGGMVMVSQVKAEDNKTVEFTDVGWPKILDDNKWTTQLLFDTVQACYQGTIRWVVVSHPGLYGQMPTLAAQRQMMEHCFCVMDKIRKENKVEEYKKKVLVPEWIGNLFMLKAMECVNKYKTLPSFFMKVLDNITTINDNETKNDTKIEVKPPDDNSGKSDSLPEQPNELPKEDVPLLNF